MAKKVNTKVAEEVTAEELEAAVDTEAVEEVMEEEIEEYELKSKSAGLLMKAADYLENRAIKKAAKKAEKAEKGGSKLMTGLKVAGGVALAGAAYMGAKYLFKEDNSVTVQRIETEDGSEAMVVADAAYEEVSEASAEE